MSKLTDELRTFLKIYTPYSFAQVGEAKIYVTYSPEQRGRGYRSQNYQVVGVGIETDSNAAWYDYGNKTFLVWGRNDKAEKRDEALKWAAKTYGIKEWAKMPFREAWIDKESYNRVMTKLKEAKEQSGGV